MTVRERKHFDQFIRVTSNLLLASSALICHEKSSTWHCVGVNPSATAVALLGSGTLM
jgi:hypothetical protein